MSVNDVDIMYGMYRSLKELNILIFHSISLLGMNPMTPGE